MSSRSSLRTLENSITSLSWLFWCIISACTHVSRVSVPHICCWLLHCSCRSEILSRRWTSNYLLGETLVLLWKQIWSSKFYFLPGNFLTFFFIFYCKCLMPGVNLKWCINRLSFRINFVLNLLWFLFRSPWWWTCTALTTQYTVVSHLHSRTGTLLLLLRWAIPHL